MSIPQGFPTPEMIVDDHYETCRKTFVPLIAKEKFSEAEECLQRYQYLNELFKEKEPFDGAMEKMVQGSTHPATIVKMAQIMERLKISTPFSTLCQLGGLLALNNQDDATALLQKNPEIQIKAKAYLNLYKSMEPKEGPLCTFTRRILNFNPVPLTDQADELSCLFQFFDLCEHHQFDQADALIGNYQALFGPIKNVKAFEDKLDDLLQKDSIVEPYNHQIIYMASIMEKHGFTTDFSLVCHVGALITLGTRVPWLPCIVLPDGTGYRSMAAGRLAQDPELIGKAKHFFSVFRKREYEDGPRCTFMSRILKFKPDPSENS